MFSSDVHRAKQLAGMWVTDFGICISCNAVQLIKALGNMAFTLCGSSISASDVHEPKALQPIVLRPVGSDTLFSDVQEWKHMAGMKSICAWISTLVSLLQCAKAL